MRSQRLILLFLLSAMPLLALTPESTREQIIAELGKPTSVAKLGSREILNFPKGVRLELEDGRIVATKGILLEDQPAEEAPEPAPTLSTPTQPAAKATAPAPKPPATPATVPKPVADSTPSEESDPAVDESYEKMMKTLETASDGQTENAHGESKHGFDLFEFIVELALSMIITVIALKLACKYWGATVFWSAIATVAAVDTGVRAAIAGLLIGVAGFPDTFYADQAVATLVMFFLLKKLSINHSIPQAVQLTMTTKTFTVVVGLMLISIILQML